MIIFLFIFYIYAVIAGMIKGPPETQQLGAVHQISIPIDSRRCELQNETDRLHASGLIWSDAEEAVYRHEYITNSNYSQAEIETALDWSYHMPRTQPLTGGPCKQ